MARKELELGEEYDDVVAARNAYVDSLMHEQFQLAGMGTVFCLGTKPGRITHKEVCYALNKLGSLGFAESFELLPRGWEPQMLYAPMTAELVAALVPFVIQSIERKVMSGTISIYSSSNLPLFYISHILGWYNHQKLRGPIPEFNPMIRAQHMAVKYRQNAVLSCPLCNHQFMPPAHLVTQQAKYWAWVMWLPKHGFEYHLYDVPKKLWSLVPASMRPKKESSK